MKPEQEMWLDASVGELAKVVEGQILQGDFSTRISGIGTDTRQSMSGQLFIPFKGDSFDAHDFLEKAQEQGAIVALIHRQDLDLKKLPKMAIVQVDDTLKAFHRLARHRRRSLPTRIIAITGSNGKTTTKEFCAAILEAEKQVYWSRKSFNNHWGVPISLLSIRPQDEVALIEMGMNHLGELTELCQIAEPDVVTVTFVGRSHLEGLGSVDGVAKGKEEIYLASPSRAQKIFNIDNLYTKKMWERQKAQNPAERFLTFGQSSEADVSFQLIGATLKGIEVEGHIDRVAGSAVVPVFGKHNVVNLMAAAALSLAAGLAPERVWARLSQCRSAWGRGDLLSLPNGTPVLFDGYNANPESMGALLDNLQLLTSKGKKIGVFGEMKELGAAGAEEHRQLGQKVATQDFSAIWFVGPSKASFKAGLEEGGFNKTLFISDSYEESLALKLSNMLEPEDIAVIKGSRGVKLERVLQAWGLKNYAYST